MDGGAAVKNILTFEEAWPVMQREGIDKIIHCIETDGQPVHQCFTSEEYMRLYTIVYNVCSPNKLSPEVQKMYEQYRKTFEDYISSKVLPALRGKQNVNLLKELVRRWNNHRAMKRWLTRFFNFIDRYYIPFKKLPSLGKISNSAFYNLVFGEMKDRVNDAIISMINKEREGEAIDRALMKEVLDIYAEESSRNYGEYIEKAIIEATSTFYSKKASNWIGIMSEEAYTLKVEECLQQEKNRASDYMIGIKWRHKVFEVWMNETLNINEEPSGTT